MAKSGEEPLIWHKSSACNPSECVAVAFRRGYVLVRDSADDSSLMLQFPLGRWRIFLKKITGNINSGSHRAE